MIATSLSAAASVRPIVSPPVARIDLLAILRENGWLFAALTDGRRNWIVQVPPCDLPSFSRFQSWLSVDRGLLVDHRSQDAPRAEDRRREWLRAVRTAFKRGQAA